MTWNSGLGCHGLRSAADDANGGDDSEQTVSQSRIEEGIVATRQLSAGDEGAKEQTEDGAHDRVTCEHTSWEGGVRGGTHTHTGVYIDYTQFRTSLKIK